MEGNHVEKGQAAYMVTIQVLIVMYHLAVLS